MKVICENLPYSRKKCVAAIGTFDGIHLGHQFILKRVKEAARNLSVSSLLITFDIPPQIILNKNFDGCITNFEEKKEVIKSLGIDYLWFLSARSRLLKLSGEQFLSYILDYFDIIDKSSDECMVILKKKINKNHFDVSATYIWNIFCIPSGIRR